MVSRPSRSRSRSHGLRVDPIRASKCFQWPIGASVLTWPGSGLPTTDETRALAVASLGGSRKMTMAEGARLDFWCCHDARYGNHRSRSSSESPSPTVAQREPSVLKPSSRAAIVQAPFPGFPIRLNTIAKRSSYMKHGKPDNGNKEEKSKS